MKYSTIIAGLGLVYFVARWIAAVVEHGMPPYPLYYIASVIEVVLAYFTMRFSRRCTTRRKRALLLLFMAVCYAAPIVFVNLKVDVLWQAGGSQVWYLVAMLSFWLIPRFRKELFASQNTEQDEFAEDGSKAIIIFMLVMLIFFVPIMILIWLLDIFG